MHFGGWFILLLCGAPSRKRHAIRTEHTEKMGNLMGFLKKQNKTCPRWHRNYPTLNAQRKQTDRRTEKNGEIELFFWEMTLSWKGSSWKWIRIGKNFEREVAAEMEISKTDGREGSSHKSSGTRVYSMGLLPKWKPQRSMFVHSTSPPPPPRMSQTSCCCSEAVWEENFQLWGVWQ